jgi:GAF domain-containing protein
MAATFDSHEMSKAGIRSIINVPIVVLGRCVGVLSFRREDERFSPGEVFSDVS